MSDETNYTEEEMFTIVEFQLGMPQATNPNRTVNKKAMPPTQPRNEGQYYNDLTELLFLLCKDFKRVAGLRKNFYARHGIQALENVQQPDYSAFVPGQPFDFGTIKR